MKLTKRDWTLFEIGLEHSSADGVCHDDEALVLLAQRHLVAKLDIQNHVASAGLASGNASLFVLHSRVRCLSLELLFTYCSLRCSMLQEVRVTKKSLSDFLLYRGPQLGTLWTLSATIAHPLSSNSFESEEVAIMNHIHEFDIFEDEHKRFFLRRHTFSPLLMGGDEFLRPRTTSTELKIMSYNLWNFEKGYDARMNKVVQQIKTVNPDVLAVQEVRYSNWEHPSHKGSYNQF